MGPHTGALLALLETGVSDLVKTRGLRLLQLQCWTFRKTKDVTAMAMSFADEGKVLPFQSIFRRLITV
jgi:hypothetical protein